ncbi:hypothetical protein BDF19DRAFT_29380 [Syncephalis fuscata]|nr:hypothetical protein BDF19DRAFT_29380 [Syncephalis fuscata]
MGLPSTSMNSNNDQDTSSYLKRPRIAYYGAGCRMNEPPISRAQRFDGTFGKKYNKNILLAYATRRKIECTEAVIASTTTDEPKQDSAKSKGKQPAAAVSVDSSNNKDNEDDAPPTTSIAAQTLLGAIYKAAEAEVPVPLPITPYNVVNMPPKLSSAVRQHHEQVAKRAAAMPPVDESPSKQKKTKIGRDLLLEQAPKETKERFNLKRKPSEEDEVTLDEATSTKKAALSTSAIPAFTGKAKDTIIADDKSTAVAKELAATAGEKTVKANIPTAFTVPPAIVSSPEPAVLSTTPTATVSPPINVSSSVFQPPISIPSTSVIAPIVPSPRSPASIRKMVSEVSIYCPL